MSEWQVVRVICDDVSHEGKVARVQAFSNRSGDWGEDQPYTAKGRRDTKQWRVEPGSTPPRDESTELDVDQWIREASPPPTGTLSAQTLIDDEVAESPVAGFVRAIGEGRQARKRHGLRCPLCDLTVPVRDETLTPILQCLADAGVSSVTLRGLQSILK